MSTAVLYTGAKINFGDLTPYLTHGSVLSTLVNPDVIIYVMPDIRSTLSVWLRLRKALSLARHWQTPWQMILLYTQVQYLRGTGGSYVEKPDQT